ncbi:MAG TPA: phosphohydrolase [Myxococcales bacterium]|nr:phosphohydrolase [Myxococcales bacterium]
MIQLHSEQERHRPLWELVKPHLKAGEMAHDQFHIERVYQWALKLAPQAGVNLDLAGATALVHDLVPIPKDSPQRSLGGEKSAAACGPLLDEVGYSDDEQAVIIDAVQTSSWSRGRVANSALGRLLQDADRLDAIGAVGIARCIACAQDMSNSENPGRFYHPSDPAGQSDRPLDDRLQALDHFRAKLLTLAEGMHYPLAQTEGARRHAHMEAFIRELALELSGTSE